MRRVLCLLFVCLLLMIAGANARSETLSFSATGCGPYQPDEEPLLSHYVDLVNRDGKSQFLVHLGDIVTGKQKQWPESQYAKVASILRRSTKPTLVVLGDNEWNDLQNPDEGMTYWNKHFRGFEKHFEPIVGFRKQDTRDENFSFVMKGVLVLGVNLVGGRVHDKKEWADRLQDDADWVKLNLEEYGSQVRAAVVLGQTTPTASHELFFGSLEAMCNDWKKPVLYLHADGHVWQLEKGWRAPNLWRVQTDQVKLNPPVLVSVTDDPNNPFEFDRRRDIGKRRELFVDDYLIENLRNVTQKVERPEPREIVLTCDAPWEGNISAYYTIFRDGDRYRMYYRGAHFDEAAKKSAHPEFACYAESRDGVNWTKPNLGLIEFEGSKANNIILTGEGTHNFSPFLDANPACSPDARYKALAGDGKGLKAYKSSDGVHWVLIQDKPVITKGDFDSQNIAFWHPTQKRYLAYHRKSRNGVRDIMMSVSADFLNWNDPRFLEYGDAPAEHLYTNAIQPYFRSNHLLIGFPTRYQPSNSQVEPVFMSSRDGLGFKRGTDALIPITAPKDRDGNRSNYMAYGLVDIDDQPKELSVYGTEAYYSGPGSRLRRFTYRTDGFVSLTSGGQPGEVITKSFTYSGGLLNLNYRADAGGTVRVEIQDEQGLALEGLSMDDCVPLNGDSVSANVSWKHKSTDPSADLTKFAGKPIRLKFMMQDASLYSFQFSDP